MDLALGGQIPCSGRCGRRARLLTTGTDSGCTGSAGAVGSDGISSAIFANMPYLDLEYKLRTDGEFLHMMTRYLKLLDKAQLKLAEDPSKKNEYQ
jgi:hypothetical protein